MSHDATSAGEPAVVAVNTRAVVGNGSAGTHPPVRSCSGRVRLQLTGRRFGTSPVRVFTSVRARKAREKEDILSNGMMIYLLGVRHVSHALLLLRLKEYVKTLR